MRRGGMKAEPPALLPQSPLLGQPPLFWLRGLATKAKIRLPTTFALYLIVDAKAKNRKLPLMFNKVEYYRLTINFSENLLTYLQKLAELFASKKYIYIIDTSLIKSNEMGSFWRF